MSGYDAAQIEKPQFFNIKHLKTGRGNRKVHVIGFDTEADQGKPFLLQFNESESADDTTLLWLRTDVGVDCLDAFIRYINEHCTRKDTEYIIVGWNLAYEYTQLFGYVDDPGGVTLSPSFEVIYTLRDGSGNMIARYKIEVANYKREALKITNLSTHRQVKVIDGMAFFVTSLDKAASILGIGNKEPKPKRFHAGLRGNAAFERYAKVDAYLTRKIGQVIMDLHETYDVTTCISAPQFAAKVFRHSFLNTEIALAGGLLEQAGLSSYHGGKNGYYLPAPVEFKNVYAYDITSAYPEAMRSLPDLETAIWNEGMGYRKGFPGIWCVSGQYQRCKYRCMLKHEKGFADRGPVRRVWITSYELDSMIEHGEFEMTECYGFWLDGKPATGALTEYVDRFFEMKATSTGVMREVAKLFLNSLYGKFFQKVEIFGDTPEIDVESMTDATYDRESVPFTEKRFRAGGLYHPPIASLITGYVRAKIHKLEHKYDAIMTSTDGFFAHKAPDPADVGKHLGGLTVERGTVRIWRERLYAFKPKDKRTWTKYALHGFRGKLHELLDLPLKPGSYEYKAMQMMTLKLARLEREGKLYGPGQFAELTFVLHLGNDP